MNAHREETLTEELPVRTTLKVIGWLLALTAAAVAGWANLHYQATTTAARVEEHAGRIEKLEAGQADIAVIRNNVEWIREVLERDRTVVTENRTNGR